MANLSHEIILVVTATFFLLLVAVGIVTLVLVYRRKQVEYVHEQNRLKAAFEKELLGAQLEIQEQTMKHIAQEIHDNIGATLSLAKINLATLKPAADNTSIEKVTTAKDLLTKAISGLRTLSKTLHADAVLSAGLAEAIEMELKLIEKTGVCKTSLEIKGDPVAIDPQKELIVFRTVQEALNNSIKHSGASQLTVILAYQPQLLEIIMEDDGTGFQPEAVNNKADKGSGLRNMQNRIKLIGGRFIIDGTNGTRIQISLPIIAA